MTDLDFNSTRLRDGEEIPNNHPGGICEGFPTDERATEEGRSAVTVGSIVQETAEQTE